MALKEVEWLNVALLLVPIGVLESQKLVFRQFRAQIELFSIIPLAIIQNIENPSTQSRAESERFAREIQAFHMKQGWNDSGHNFLVCRNGLILQGRWLTVSSIQAQHMVRSAHCPGQNEQIGIEHEHLGNEEMTKQQREASARLMAWIADQYDRNESTSSRSTFKVSRNGLSW